MGGLFEYNDKGGLTPSYGAQDSFYNVYCRKQIKDGITLTGSATEAEGGKGSQVVAYNCVCENNSVYNFSVKGEVGKDVKGVKPGDHVVVDLVVACGECPQCKSGRRNVCRTVKARGSAIDGGWREYFAVPEHEVYLLPEDMPFRDAALIEPFAIGGHCTTRAGVKGGESVLVLGSGTIGAVILQTLKDKGCRVICADINDDSLAQGLRRRRHCQHQEGEPEGCGPEVHRRCRCRCDL